MDLVDARDQGSDLQLDNFLQQYILELQGSQAASSLGLEHTLPTSISSDKACNQFDPSGLAANAPTKQGLHRLSQPQQENTAALDSFQQHQEPPDVPQRSSSSGSGRGKGRDSSSGSGKRTEAWTLKNRRAQKKFRERQKANKSQMQQQFAEMSAQLQALELENNQLTGRNVVLEKVLHSRQVQLQILQDHSKATQQLSASPQSNLADQLALAKQSDPCKAKDTVGPLVQPQPFEVNAVYAGMVAKVQSVMDRIEQEGHNPEVDAELEKACLTVGYFIKDTVLGNAENLRKLYVVNIDPEEWDTSDLLYRMPEHWEAVTDCLQLTDDQKAEMVQLRAECLMKQAANQAQWHQLCNAIAQNTSYDVADKIMQPELAKDGQRLHDLKANLRRGQDIWLQLYQQIFVKVWTRIQYARAVIASGPHHIDALAIATCVAQRHPTAAGTELLLN